jgi:hypothetical protein
MLGERGGNAGACGRHPGEVPGGVRGDAGCWCGREELNLHEHFQLYGF